VFYGTIEVGRTRHNRPLRINSNRGCGL